MEVIYNERLHSKLKERGYTQKRFAKELKTNKAKVSMVTNGLRNILLSEQEKWAKKLGCTVEEIFS